MLPLMVLMPLLLMLPEREELTVEGLEAERDATLGLLETLGLLLELGLFVTEGRLDLLSTMGRLEPLFTVGRLLLSNISLLEMFCLLELLTFFKSSNLSDF